MCKASRGLIIEFPWPEAAPECIFEGLGIPAMLDESILPELSIDDEVIPGYPGLEIGMFLFIPLTMPIFPPATIRTPRSGPERVPGTGKLDCCIFLPGNTWLNCCILCCSSTGNNDVLGTLYRPSLKILMWGQTSGA